MDPIMALLQGGDPMEEQKRLAARLRGEEAMKAMMQNASKEGQGMDILNFVAANSGNKPLADSVGLLTKTHQARNAPMKLDHGIMIPSSGEYQASPGYEDDRENERDTRRLLAMSAAAERQRATDALERSRAEATAARRDSANLMYQVGMDRNEAMRERRANADTAKKDKDHDTAVTKFGVAMTKSGVPEFEAALETAEGRLAKHKPGELPGYGRFEGAVPDMLATNEQQMSRSDFQRAANILLNIRSGKAVTNAEQARFLREVASGKGFSEEAMRHGWQSVRQGFEAMKDGVLAEASDPVLSTYNERSGRQYTRGAKKGGDPKPKSEADAYLDQYAPKTP